MSYTLFLDDLREPGTEFDNSIVSIARTVESAVRSVVLLGVPETISLDHDLGGGETAMDFMWFLIEGHLDQKFDLNKIKSIIIHSANPVGAKNLAGLWDGFAVNELDTQVRAELKPRA